MTLRGGSLDAVLTRTKTSGKDKKMEALPLHVLSEAYLDKKNWLAVGFGLWEKAKSDRDIVLVLPDATRQGTLNIEATYVDSMAMNRALLCQAPRSHPPTRDREAPLCQGRLSVAGLSIRRARPW